MSPKSIITIVLLLFVGSSIVYLVAKGDTDEAEASRVDTQPSDDQDSALPSPDTSTPAVVVYYLHGSRRCRGCLVIENLAREVVHDSFAAELEAGRVIWRSINYDEPGNSHYRRDFELAFPSLIVAEEIGEERVRWENLAEVWSLAGNREAYSGYVQNAVSEYLGN